MAEERTEFGRWVLRHGHRASEIARALGTLHSNVIRYMTGEQIPKLDMMDRIERYTKGEIGRKNWPSKQLRPRGRRAAGQRRDRPETHEAVPHPRGIGELAPETWEAAEAADETLTSGRVEVDQQGRITLPSSILAALDSGPGGRIPWRFEDGELKLMSRAAGIRAAQALVEDLWKDHPISSDALIAERRAEAARQDARFKRRRRG